MQKSRSYKIFAFLLAALMMISSTGFAIDTHFCRGHLVSVSLFGHAKCCGKMTMTSEVKSQHKILNCKAMTSKSNCCHNKTFQIQKIKTKYETANKPVVQKAQMTAIVLFVSLLLPTHFSEKANYQPYKNYKPPIADVDISVLNQSFLI